MSDRKALRLFIVVFLAMTGATIWQLSLLPDWRHVPIGGSGSHNTVNGLVLFGVPASLLLFMVSPFLQWLALPEEALPSLRRWSGKWIASMSVFMALCQAFSLSCTLGIVAPIPGRHYPDLSSEQVKRLHTAAERHQLIAEIAYSFAEGRGLEPGQELSDWLAAERVYQ